jgi:glyoxylate utilization-related uncharacterized protein
MISSLRTGLRAVGVPRGFDRRVVVVPPGGRRNYDEAEWHDSLVLVEAGAIELVGLSGRGFRFEQGGVLWLAGLPLLALRNTGAEPVVLVALRRERRREELVGREVVGEAEEREEVRVEEVVVPDDAAVLDLDDLERPR